MPESKEQKQSIIKDNNFSNISKKFLLWERDSPCESCSF